MPPGQIYGYRVEGPSDPARGLRFDPAKVLLDPYGRGVVVPKGYDREAARREGDNAATAMKSVVVEPGAYDWEGDLPLGRPSSRTIIYEMHVRGFTRHPSSGVGEKTRGTFAGLIEKIPYLRELGITAVELLPVFAFDPQACPPGLVNYWGYQPVSFFAPHPAYSSRRDALGPVDEFRDMVKALHRAGIEVILDVVFNHTAEGDHTGPTLGFRGIDNPTYYILEQGGSRYADYTGCGNTLNGNHPIVRRMIVDSLRYWVEEMHVDGFRFDLASILARDASGHPLPNPPVLWDIESDPALAGTKLIAEAWDAAGLYQVGSFVGDAWKEWNGRFRDDVRDFFRGDAGSVRRVADRLVGSPEVYGHKGREAEQSVNFVTCHDGFTLNDLVSYNDKHNEANGEDNRDGAERQPELELRRRGPDRRPRRRAAAQPPGEESPRGHADVAGRAHDPDGGRGPAHAAGQQQRLLPRRPVHLVRLDAPGEARRRPPLREPAGRAAIAPRRGARASAREPEHLPAGGEQGLARREAERAGLGRLFAQPRPGRGASRGGAVLPPHPERVLGAARVRAAGRSATGARGGDGSTRRSTRRTTSSPGRRRRRSPASSYRAGARSVVMLYRGRTRTGARSLSARVQADRTSRRRGQRVQVVSGPDGASSRRLGDEEATVQVLSQAVLGLWEVVNNLTRLRPTRRERYRVTIFGSARIDPDHWVYAAVRDLAAELTRLGCDIVTGGGPGLMQAANEGARTAGADPTDFRRHPGRAAVRAGRQPVRHQVFEHRTFFSRLHHSCSSPTPRRRPGGSARCWRR